MAAHTLEATRTELLRCIAAHANWARDPSNWSTDQVTDGYDILKEALCQFYFPQPLPGDRVPWEWRFLWLEDSLDLKAQYSTGTVTVVADASGSIATLADGTWPSWAADGEVWIDDTRYIVLSRTSNSVIRLVDIAVTVAAGTSYSLRKFEYPLPDDYGSIDSRGFTYPRGNDRSGRIPIIEEATFRMLDQSESAGYTTYATIMPLPPNDDTESTRWYAKFWPTPDADVSVDYVYRAAPPTLSALASPVNIYSYGGPAHALTVKASVEDMTFQKVHRSFERHDKFLEQLYRSVRLDQKRGAPHLRGKGVRSLAPTGRGIEQALYDHRADTPINRENINFL
jgi:hypothetical protein